MRRKRVALCPLLVALGVSSALFSCCVKLLLCTLPHLSPNDPFYAKNLTQTHLSLKPATKNSPRVEAGKNTLPGHKTPLDGLLLTGDYTFPGIGVPATAASGAVTANTLVTVDQHKAMLDKIRLPKKK